MVELCRYTPLCIEVTLPIIVRTYAVHVVLIQQFYLITVLLEYIYLLMLLI